MKRISKSAEYLNSVLESDNSLERTIEMNQHFPCVPLYSELNKRKAEMLLKNNQTKEGVMHLVESHGVGLRHAALNSQRERAQRKFQSLSNGTESTPKPVVNKDFETCMDFGKVVFPSWLGSLPSEWTVVQVTEMWQGCESIKMMGYGPPPLIKNLPNLIMVRFSGNNVDSLLTHTLERPAGEVRGSLLAEMSSILDGNRLINKEFRGNRDQYWKLKQEHHEQLKVLVDSLENWWLDYSKCLFIGELAEPSDVKQLDAFTSAIIKIFKSHKRITSETEKAWLRLFLSCYCYLSHQQLMRGLLRTFNLNPRDKMVSDFQSYIRSIEQQLEKFKEAKRNPVILVLDKTIQQLPWESMPVLSTTPISRVPSLHFLNSLTLKYGFDDSTKENSAKRISPCTDLKLRTSSIQVNPKLIYYMINPEQNLPGVQQRLQPILEEIWGKNCGLSGAIPIEQEIKNSLMERDLFLYCGHGSGSKYFPNDHLVKLECRAAPILMGCSSGQMQSQGRIVDPTGAPAYYLMAGSPGFVGMLWEVTDVDCDRFTIRLLDFLTGARKDKSSNEAEDIQGFNRIESAKNKKSDLPSPPKSVEPEMLRAVALSRPITKNFLTGSAAVVYGLPLRVLEFNKASSSDH